jgi:hypothetical protein
MAREDDYREAKKIAIETLRKDSIADLAARSGFECVDENSLRVPFFDRIYRIDYPGFDICDISGGDEAISLQEQVVIFHYIIGAGSASAIGGHLIPYREIPGASFYHAVFIKRAVDPLKNVFGHNPSTLSPLAGRLNGRSIDHGDVSFEFSVLPKVPIQIILWRGDEEFPAEANILFDSTISDIFSPEDVAWIASLLVYRLIALTKKS